MTKQRCELFFKYQFFKHLENKNHKAGIMSLIKIILKKSLYQESPSSAKLSVKFILDYDKNNSKLIKFSMNTGPI